MQRQKKIKDVSDEIIVVHLLRPTVAVLYDTMRGDPIPVYQCVMWEISVDVSPEDVATHRDAETGELYAILMSQRIRDPDTGEPVEGLKMEIVPDLCDRAEWNKQAAYNGVPRR